MASARDGTGFQDPIGLRTDLVGPELALLLRKLTGRGETSLMLALYFSTSPLEGGTMGVFQRT